jgi:predicted transcriptional regulator
MYSKLVITENELKLYNFIWQYQNHYRVGPTYEEMATGVGMWHTSNLYTLIKRMLQKKVLTQVNGNSRGSTRGIKAVRDMRWLDNSVKHVFNEEKD